MLGSLPNTKGKRKERTRNSEPDFDKILILISNVRFMNISVIIPTYNEQDNIEKLIAFLQNVKDHEQIIEIILVDGWSADNTMFLAQRAGARVLKSEVRKRSLQMNMGAEIAKGEIFYFLHADTQPPDNFVSEIIEQVEKGNLAGSFRVKFDQNHWFLNLISWFTQFNNDFFRFGDQSLFVTSEVFNFAGRFDTDLILMEDQEFVGRLRKYGEFTIMSNNVVTSARKFRENGIFRLFWIFLKIYILYQIGRPQSQLVKIYQDNIKGSKIGTTTTR